MPHRRRVCPLGADNRKIPVLIAIDITCLGFGSTRAIARRES
jgi:hypothetical protein